MNTISPFTALNSTPGPQTAAALAVPEPAPQDSVRLVEAPPARPSTSVGTAVAAAAAASGPAGLALAAGTGGASGWIGQNHLNAYLRYDGTWSDLDGTLGGAFVDLRGHSYGSSTRIDGTLSGRGGYARVDMDVRNHGSGADYSGFLDRHFISVRDSGDADSGWITGSIGGQFLNVHRRRQGDLVVYIGSAGGGFVNLTANVVDGVTRHDALIPLLALTGRT